MALPLTDTLALQRNRLANERTLLAYIRTFLSFLVAGVSLIQFFQVRVFIILGFILIPSAFLILFFGAWRYVRVRKKLQAAE